MSDGVILSGLPGSGKSTIGARVAALLQRPFVDIDTEVERAAGLSPAGLISERGEAALRSLEQSAIEAAVKTEGAVIATGGGSVLDPLNRWLLMEHGARVLLDAPLERLADRLRAHPEPRPLLGTDLAAGLRRTLAERADVYAANDAVVDASADVETVARSVAAIAEQGSLGGWRSLVEVGYERHSPVGPPVGHYVAGRGMDADVVARTLAAVSGGRAAIVADRRALSAQPGLNAVLPAGVDVCALDAGEEAKSMATLAELLAWLSASAFERSDVLVVVGGGTLGDVGGLAAALHRRGIPLVAIPTTWLSQSDASIGGKVAIDLPEAKNGVGTFWPAWRILVDADLPASLPPERRRDGIAECLKAGLIGDERLWQLIEDRGPAALAGDDRAVAYAITERAARVKLAIVQRDPYEVGERRLLNLGHTLGHALEVESDYQLAHGQAIALGLRGVARIAAGRGAEAGLAERIDALLDCLGLPLRRSFDRSRVKAALGGDKKRIAGRQRWLLPLAVGRVVEADDVSAAEVESALDVIAAP